MSKLPINIVNFDEENDYDLDTAVNIANAIQEDFIFSKVDRIAIGNLCIYSKR
jgi:hypothetical protein